MIYFIAQGDRFIKVGHVKGDPRHRLTSIQTANPYPLKLEMVLEGDEKDEKKVHRMFMHLHIRGEWFFFTREIESQLEMWREYCILSTLKSDVPENDRRREWIRKGVKGIHKWG